MLVRGAGDGFPSAVGVVEVASWKGDEVFVSSVEVTAAVVDRGRWTTDACAAIAAKMSTMRSRYS
ncbi:hypothetical protein [Streptosporangium sp. NPDC002524]|uniref:hypothetical protein n=1 Tax=Streptosporangium sp. NPDC002524 TaxID=3154537 RepID=UPI003330C0BB